MFLISLPIGIQRNVQEVWDEVIQWFLENFDYLYRLVDNPPAADTIIANEQATIGDHILFLDYYFRRTDDFNRTPIGGFDFLMGIREDD